MNPRVPSGFSNLVCNTKKLNFERQIFKSKIDVSSKTTRSHFSGVLKINFDLKINLKKTIIFLIKSSLV